MNQEARSGLFFLKVAIVHWNDRRKWSVKSSSVVSVTALRKCIKWANITTASHVDKNVWRWRVSFYFFIFFFRLLLFFPSSPGCSALWVHSRYLSVLDFYQEVTFCITLVENFNTTPNSCLSNILCRHTSCVHLISKSSDRPRASYFFQDQAIKQRRKKYKKPEENKTN